MLEITLLLFLVIDPFGNLPFVLAVLRRLEPGAYRRAIGREIGLAFLVLLGFAVAGEAILAYFRIDQASMQISGGIILFLISLKMLFQSSAALFSGDYNDDPILVPIAVPAIAGPAAITTLIILRNQQQADLTEIIVAVLGVLALTALVLLAGRRLQQWLGSRGIDAMEKLMGLVLNMVAVNMVLGGIRLTMGS